MSSARQYELVYIVTPDASEQDDRRSAHADRADRPALQAAPSTRPRTGAAQAGLRDRPSPRGHLRRRDHHRLGRADEGNRSPPARDRLGHPASRRPRRRGAAGGASGRATRARRPGAAPHGARPAAGAAAGRRPRRRRLSRMTWTVWRSSDEGRTRRWRRGGGRGGDKKDDKGGEAPRAADSSGAGASASSARRRSTTSTTRTSGCSRRSCRSAARSSRGGSPARARCTSAKLQIAIKRARQLALIPYVTD